MNEGAVEAGIELAVDGVVEQAVADARLVDMARLGVGDVERLVTAVPVRLILQVLMKRVDVVEQTMLELLHVFFVPLSAYELFPGEEQIIYRNDIVIGMSELYPPGTPPPPQKLLPVLERLKQSYLLWHGYHQILPKTHRYSLGQKIDTLFIETIEAGNGAAFLSRAEKLPYVRVAVRKLDTLKLLLLLLWETKSIDTNKYVALSLKLHEVGKMLGGWQGQLIKQNSPAQAEEK